jgi:hypothetical protein
VDRVPNSDTATRARQTSPDRIGLAPGHEIRETPPWKSASLPWKRGWFQAFDVKVDRHFTWIVGI